MRRTNETITNLCIFYLSQYLIQVIMVSNQTVNREQAVLPHTHADISHAYVPIPVYISDESH